MEDNQTITVEAGYVDIKERENTSKRPRRSNSVDVFECIKVIFQERNKLHNSPALKQQRPIIQAQYAQNSRGHNIHKNDH